VRTGAGGQNQPQHLAQRQRFRGSVMGMA
jgi:hypothetical protein